MEKIAEISWMRSFYEPKPPGGWKLVEESLDGGGELEQQQPADELDSGIAPAGAEEARRRAQQPKRR